MIAASPAGLRVVVVRAWAWARAQAVVYGTSFSYITAVLGSIRNTQCACATRWIVPLIHAHDVCVIMNFSKKRDARIHLRT